MGLLTKGGLAAQGGFWQLPFSAFFRVTSVANACKCPEMWRSESWHLHLALPYHVRCIIGEFVPTDLAPSTLVCEYAVSSPIIFHIRKPSFFWLPFCNFRKTLRLSCAFGDGGFPRWAYDACILNKRIAAGWIVANHGAMGGEWGCFIIHRSFFLRRWYGRCLYWDQ